MKFGGRELLEHPWLLEAEGGHRVIRLDAADVVRGRLGEQAHQPRAHALLAVLGGAHLADPRAQPPTERGRRSLLAAARRAWLGLGFRLGIGLGFGLELGLGLEAARRAFARAAPHRLWWRRADVLRVLRLQRGHPLLHRHLDRLGRLLLGRRLLGVRGRDKVSVRVRVRDLNLTLTPT